MGILDKFKSKTEDKEDKNEEQEQIETDIDAKALLGESRILVRPIVSEKSAIKEQDGKYTFEVKRGANKIEVKEAIEKTYGVRPKKVNTMNMKGKRKRFGLQEGKRKNWKKAVVTLPEGEDINIHEGV